ncbi:MAG: poly-gamma-glutamate synthase PgsB [Marinisporobacter sp.]|jgi:poly-gamma-glutamate synthase PgsB/CapB|nr:poly-gamma-glutamate synthase PgsB [Marinisporobacter sp.]
MIETLILILTIGYITWLVLEYKSNIEARKKIPYVIHVNGTRGKSSVCRLIDAGLRAGGYSVFTKTTGTSPRIIHVNGEETEIIRKGRANIKEQIKILKLARREQAQVMVIECMAVNPDLQYIAQNRILKANIGVITNVRRDHLEEMGPRLEDVAESLGLIIPKGGIFITGDEKFYPYYSQIGREKNTIAILSENNQESYEIDFCENVSVALEVCKALKVDREIALEGMKNYKKDPGTLKVYEILTKTNNKVYFVNAFAVNDPDSIVKVYDLIKEMKCFYHQKMIILLNNRIDRAYRMKQHVDCMSRIFPDEIWITGSLMKLMKRKLIYKDFHDANIKIFSKLENLNFEGIEEDTIIFAIGNIGGRGELIVKHVEGIGESFAG